jgi:hypothetical protein
VEIALQCGWHRVLRGHLARAESAQVIQQAMDNWKFLEASQDRSGSSLWSLHDQGHEVWRLAMQEQARETRADETT